MNKGVGQTFLSAGWGDVPVCPISLTFAEKGAGKRPKPAAWKGCPPFLGPSAIGVVLQSCRRSGPHQSSLSGLVSFECGNPRLKSWSIVDRPAGTLATAKPFAQKHALDVLVVDGLRERLIVNDDRQPSDEVWCKSWEDFTFALAGCESSVAAKRRIRRAMVEITQRTNCTSVVFTRGNVIGLFLNSLVSSFGRREAEALTNPDVLKVDWRKDSFTWDFDFRLRGLEAIATQHRQTPTEEGPASSARV